MPTTTSIECIGNIRENGQFRKDPKQISFDINSLASVLAWRRILFVRYYCDIGRRDNFKVNWADYALRNEKLTVIDVADSERHPLRLDKLPHKDLFKTLVQIHMSSQKLVTITLFYSTRKVLIQGHFCQDWIDSEFDSIHNMAGLVITNGPEIINKVKLLPIPLKAITTSTPKRTKKGKLTLIDTVNTVTHQSSEYLSTLARASSTTTNIEELKTTSLRSDESPQVVSHRTNGQIPPVGTVITNVCNNATLGSDLNDDNRAVSTPSGDKSSQTRVTQAIDSVDVMKLVEKYFVNLNIQISNLKSELSLLRKDNINCNDKHTKLVSEVALLKQQLKDKSETERNLENERKTNQKLQNKIKNLQEVNKNLRKHAHEVTSPTTVVNEGESPNQDQVPNSSHVSGQNDSIIRHDMGETFINVSCTDESTIHEDHQQYNRGQPLSTFEEWHKVTRHKNKRKKSVFIIGDSQLKYIDEKRMLRETELSKVKAYTADQGFKALRDIHEADCIVLNIGTNDVCNQPSHNRVRKACDNIYDIIKLAKNKAPSVIVSLPLPRGDTYRNEWDIIEMRANLLHICERLNVTVCENNNFTYEGKLDSELYCSDRIHANKRDGSRCLARNICYSVRQVLQNVQMR